MATSVNCDTSCDKCATSVVTIPKVDPADKLTDPASIGIVTEEKIDGKGVFDKYMRAGGNQLDVQYKAGRIKGKEYADAFMSMMELMMTQANEILKVLKCYRVSFQLL